MKDKCAEEEQYKRKQKTTEKLRRKTHFLFRTKTHSLFTDANTNYAVEKNDQECIKKLFRDQIEDQRIINISLRSESLYSELLQSLQRSRNAKLSGSVVSAKELTHLVNVI